MATQTLEPTFTLPAHVPPELFWDGDVAAFAQQFDDPFVGIKALQDKGDFIYVRNVSRGQPGWMPTRFDIINDVFMDPTHFSSANSIGVGPMLGVDWRLNPLEYDPPEHMAYRQVLQPFFQPSAINGYEAMIRGVARELIDKFRDKKQINFVAEFASLFPSYVFLDLFGLPRDELPRFFEWEHAFTRSPDMERRAWGARSILHYLEGHVEQRRKEPRQDLMTGIINARIKDRPLTNDEVMGMVMVLYFGGLDTVLSSLGWYFRHLATHPELQDLLRANPEEIPAAADELLRAFGVVGTHRLVTQDMEFHGHQLKQGEIVMVPGWLACRDERQYDDPHKIDPSRRARHLTLATGIHNCLGVHLAKREIRVVLEEWLSSFTSIRVAPDKPQRWNSTGVWAMTELWLDLA